VTVRPGLDLRTNRRLSVARRDWRLRGPLCLERSAKSCRSTSIVHSPHECTVNRVIFYAEAIVGGQRATCFAFVQMKNMNSSVLQFLPARRYASAGNRDRNVSVRLSVRPSVTRRYCVKTKKASVMISSPSDSPKTLVFLTPNFITKF